MIEVDCSNLPYMAWFKYRWYVIEEFMILDGNFWVFPLLP